MPPLLRTMNMRTAPRFQLLEMMVVLFFSITLMIIGPLRCWAVEPAPVVSIISLIAQPEKYDRKVVWVRGYLRLGFRGNFLFLSPYDSQEFITQNALFLDIGNTALESHLKLNDSDKANRKQWQALLDHETVDLQGTFYYPPRNGGVWSGYPNGIITEITDIQLHDRHPRIGRELEP